MNILRVFTRLSIALLFSLPVSAQIAGGLQGTLIVLNKSANSASFIDLGSGETIATLATGRGPHELIISDDGRWAIGTDYAGGNSLTVFDVENLRVARTIDLSNYPRPHGIALLPGQREVILTSEGSRTLLVVDIHSGAISKVISTEANAAHMLALAADGQIAYTANGPTNSVSVVDVLAGRQLRTIAVPRRPEAITTNKAGTEIWVGSNNEQVVSVFAADNGELLDQWTGFAWPYRILLTNDERYAVIPDMTNENLRFFDVNSRAELGSINLPGAGPQGVSWYADDRTLFLALSKQSKVVAIDTVSRAILGEYATGAGPDGIAYSPLVLRKSVDYQR